MSFLDAILNLVGLLLWIDWRSEKLLLRKPRGGVTLARSLKSTERTVLRPWVSLGALLAMLLLRAFFYWNVGTAADWTPVMDLSVISLAWRSDLLSAAFLFSFVSFGLTLLAWITCLVLLSAVDARPAQEFPLQRFTKLQLGWVDRLPRFGKVLVPFLIGFTGWLALSPLFENFQMLPTSGSIGRLVLQAALLGASVFLFWKWLLIAIFGIHLLNTYVYLGQHWFWSYISHLARRLLWPVRFLRFGRVDLAPVAGIIIVLLVFQSGLELLIRRLYSFYAL